MEWFLKVVRDNYANFNGRARRKEYWMFALIYTVAYTALYIAAIVLAFVSSALASILFGIIGLLSLALIVPSLAVAVRRMHDVGKEWYFMLIPIYNIILAFTEGDRGPNEYGPDPKGEENVNPFAGQHTNPNNPFTNPNN